MDITYLAEYEARLARGLARARVLEKKYGKPLWHHYHSMSAKDCGEAFFLPDTDYATGVAQPRDGRDELTAKYAWAIPTDEALETIARYAKDRGVVEIGAGGGYWACLLAERGIDVIAYDKYPYRVYGRALHSGVENTPKWHPVIAGDEFQAGQHPDRVLFLCWPVYAEPVAMNALRAYEQAGGDTLVYIGEGYGGCTADDAFHEHIGEEKLLNFVPSWERAEKIALPQWWGLHDDMRVYVRRS